MEQPWMSAFSFLLVNNYTSSPRGWSGSGRLPRFEEEKMAPGCTLAAPTLLWWCRWHGATRGSFANIVAEVKLATSYLPAGSPPPSWYVHGAAVTGAPSTAALGASAPRALSPKSSSLELCTISDVTGASHLHGPTKES